MILHTNVYALLLTCLLINPVCNWIVVRPAADITGMSGPSKAD
jgi:hypothetical protein